ncbi:YbaB/EbfC family nucleoid-associated protein [Actinoalloteichus hymeniacidonis]|uniref:YbaB/EbfC DNA-binding family protein n=1 Tax=Actinoalloteichus hymeniacidonis TaxID=340345 RepID=A0AAC9MWZ5_9PSEU|nr:YbaB/EbfC family nucleoid-associated protein [Actinoalloteichus hymeniacidonis]AOS61694.1 hypothetical protein TL08_04320 [Actinoalloteichus hymeniacidonis]MBB5910288.1 DNA-binding protein YbaB [Actinoalloteichus hymeniacidonis]
MTGPEDRRARLEARNAAMREQVDQLMGQLRKQTDQLRDAQAEAAAASAKVSSADGLVTATVDASGALTRLEFAPSAFARSTPEKLGRTATEVVRQASTQVGQRVADIMAPLHEGTPDLADLVEGAPSFRDLLNPNLKPTAPPEAAPPPAQTRPKRPVRDDADDEEPQSWLTGGDSR